MRSKSFFFRSLLIFSCFLPLAAQAQVGQHRSDFAIGVNGGLSLNKISFQPTIKQNWKMGETFGLSFRYTCEKYFASICAINAEVNYANLGWNELIETCEDTYSRDMHYIQVPIFARMGWGRERRGGQFFLQAGPQFGYCFDEKEYFSEEWSGDGSWNRPNGVIQQYHKAIENRFEYGICGGAGVEWSGRFGHIMLDGRYFFALSDIFKNGKKDDFGRSANSPIQLKLTYLFDIVKTKGDHIK
ncbi:MAG: PorT family protein [Bacteroidales bacterium]|nr:PorT family protein [Bacteroidales bacterium]